MKNFQVELFMFPRTVFGSTKLSPDMKLTVWSLVGDWLLNMILRSELNECRSKEESRSELIVMLEIG